MFYNNNYVIYCTFILFSSGLFEITWPQIDQTQLRCNSIDNFLIMPATHLKKHCHSASTPYKTKRNCHSLPTPILYKISSDPRHQLRPFNMPMMDTLIKQELNHAIWYDANTDQLINLYFWDVVTNDILAKNVMIMKWQGTWCKPTKVKPSSTPNTTNTTPEKPPTPKHKISVWLTQVCHKLTQQIDPLNLPHHVCGTVMAVSDVLMGPL